MDIFDIIVGSICVMGSVYWLASAIFPKGMDITMQRVAYLLASLFVLEAALDFFGLLERTPLLSIMGVQ